MADYNTVPQGQAGTGAAFLLGGSKALQNWIAQDKRNKQVDAYNKQQQGVYAKELNADYTKNQIKDGAGLSWQNEIHGDISRLNEVAAQYKAQGLNVYSPDPRNKSQVLASQDFLEAKRFIEQKINAQKALDAHMKVESKALNADKYSYDPDSVQAFNNFEKNTTAGDFIKNGMALPVPEKLFDYQKNIKANLKPHFTDITTVDNTTNEKIRKKVADIPAIEKEVTGMFSQPKNKNWLDKQIGGDSNGILKTLDRDEIKKALDNEFKSPTGREIIAILKSAGKVPEYGSPEYGKFLEDATDAQLVAEQKYDKIISRAVQDGMGLVNKTTSTTNDFSMANYRMSQRRLAISEENLKLSKQKADNPFNVFINGTIAPSNTPFLAPSNERNNQQNALYSNKTTNLTKPVTMFISTDKVWGQDGKPIINNDPSKKAGLVGFKQMNALTIDIKVPEFKNNKPTGKKVTLPKGTFVQEKFAKEHQNIVTPIDVAHLRDDEENNIYVRDTDIPRNIIKDVKGEYGLFKATKTTRAKAPTTPPASAPKSTGGGKKLSIAEQMKQARGGK